MMLVVLIHRLSSRDLERALCGPAGLGASPVLASKLEDITEPMNLVLFTCKLDDDTITYIRGLLSGLNKMIYAKCLA